MAKCAGCSAACNCFLGAGTNVTITGTGSAIDPFVINAAGGAAAGEVDVFVAASNTPAARKALANYVCDGVADQVEIQAAINQLGGAGFGGRVFLMEGSFETTAPIQIMGSVSLFGFGSSRLFPATSVNYTGVTGYAIEVNNLAGIELAHMNVLSVGAGCVLFNTSSQWHSHDLSLRAVNATVPCFNANGGVEYWVNNNWIESNVSDGLVVQNNSSGEVWVVDNFILNGGLVAHLVVQHTIRGNRVATTVVKTSSVLTASAPALLGSALVVNSSGDGNLHLNRVTSSVGHGIAIKDSSRENVFGNRIDSTGGVNTFDGIFLDNGDSCSIQTNRVLDVGSRYGINISNATSTDNLVTNNDLFGGYTTAAVNDAGTATILTAGNRP